MPKAKTFKILLVTNISLWSIISCSAGESSTNKTDSSCNSNYWVSTTGDDSGNGSYTTPFKTINHARNVVQQDPQKGKCTIYVNIKGGVYTLDKALTFINLDSGSPEHPVIYRAESGTNVPVVISGGQQITDFNCSGSNCTGTVPNLPANTMPRQFYVDETRAIRARSNYRLSVNLNYIRESNGYTQIIPQALTNPELVEAVTTTQWKMMRCPVANMSGNTLVMQDPCWSNANTYPSPWNFQLLSWLENAPEFVTSPNMWYLNPYTKSIIYYNNSANPPQNAVLPILEDLLIIKGTTSQPVSNISFESLVFSYATWLSPNSKDGYVSDQSGNILLGSGYESNAIGHQRYVYKSHGNINLEYANNISFNNNTFSHLGGVALDLGVGSQNNKITNNTFTDISSAAIQIGGVNESDMRANSTDIVKNNLIANNNISYTGRDYYDTAAIFVGFTTGTTITHNTIDHTPWSGIAMGWGWGLFDKGSFTGLPGATPDMWGTYTTSTISGNNKITSNKIDHFLEELWDGGAIYTTGAQGTSFENGLLIELNVAMNKRESAGGNTYYTDGGSQYIRLNQNVSLNNPVGTVDFGPCLTGSSISLCFLTKLLPYGADMGGCLPVGDLSYTENYLADTLTFYGPNICHNSNIPPYPVNMSFINNIVTTSAAQVPSWIIQQAGVQ